MARLKPRPPQHPAQVAFGDLMRHLAKAEQYVELIAERSKTAF
jgi:hypothetical protein